MTSTRQQYIRCLSLATCTLRETSNNLAGFVTLFDRKHFYIENILERVIWSLNIDECVFKIDGEDNRIRLGPNPFFVPAVNYRGGTLSKCDEYYKFEDIAAKEVLLFSTDLLEHLNILNERARLTKR